MIAQHMLADCNRVIFLNIIVISIVAYAKIIISFFLFIKNSKILIYKNNKIIYLDILNEFVYLELGKILYFYVKLIWMF